MNETPEATDAVVTGPAVAVIEAPPPEEPAHPTSEEPPPPPAAPGTIWLDIPYPGRMSRLLLFFKWLFVIPLWFWVSLYGALAIVVSLLAFFAILFTRKYPPGLFNFVRGYLSAQYRVQGYYLLLTDQWSQNDSHPIWFHATPPEKLSRPLLLLVKLPLGIVGAVGSLTGMAHYLLVLLAIPVWFVILLTGRYPAFLFGLSRSVLQWSARLTAWQYMLGDDWTLFGQTKRTRIASTAGVAGFAVVAPLFAYLLFTGAFFDWFTNVDDVPGAELAVHEFLLAARDYDLDRAMQLVNSPAQKADVDRLIYDGRYELDGYESIRRDFFFGQTANEFSFLAMTGTINYRNGDKGRFVAALIKFNGEWKITTIQILGPP